MAFRWRDLIVQICMAIYRSFLGEHATVFILVFSSFVFYFILKLQFHPILKFNNSVFSVYTCSVYDRVYVHYCVKKKKKKKDKPRDIFLSFMSWRNGELLFNLSVHTNHCYCSCLIIHFHKEMITLLTQNYLFMYLSQYSNQNIYGSHLTWCALQILLFILFLIQQSLERM